MRVDTIALLGAAALSSAACHTMRPVTLDQLGAIRPSRVWVTRADQSVVIVDGPQTFGDTLVGYVNGKFEELPATNLAQMRVKRRAGGRTAALVTGGLLGIAALAYMVTSTGDYRNPEDKLDCEDNPDQPGCGGNPIP